MNQHNTDKEIDAMCADAKAKDNDFWEKSYLSGVTDTPEEAEELRIKIANMRQSGKFND